MSTLRRFTVLLFTAIVAWAQQPPTTTNLGLYEPLHGTLNWDTWYNANWSTLDNRIGNIGASTIASQLQNAGNCAPISKYAGADIGAQINAAYAAVGVQGGRVCIPPGSYTFSTQINVEGSRYFAIIGAGGQSAGATATTTLTYTGTASPVSARSTVKFVWSNIMLICNNAAFNTIGIDYGHGTSGMDSTWGVVEDSSFFATGGAIFNPTINLNQAINMTIQRNNFGTAFQVAIAGSNVSYSNVVQIVHNNFACGAFCVNAIQNPIQAWRIENNTFEMTGSASGTAIGNTGVGSFALGIFGNWIGDSDAGRTGRVIYVLCGGGCEISGGNYIAGNGTGSDGIVLGAGSNGVVIHGNHFNSLLNAVNTNGAVGRVFSEGNYYQSVTNMAGSFTNLSGRIESTAGAETITGDQTLTGNITFSGTPTFAGAGAVNWTPPQVYNNYTRWSAMGAGVESVTGASVAGLTYFFGGPGGTISGEFVYGNGSGWSLDFAKRSGSVTTMTQRMKDDGTIDVGTGYRVGGTAGFSGSKTAGTCIFTISGGIITNVTGC